MTALNRFVTPAVRVLFGLVFLVFGLNGFLGFLPQPPVPDAAGAFLGALAETGYMFPVIKGIEVLAGILLLSNRLVALALALLAPIVFNIVAFHFVLAPPTPLSFIVLLGEAWLLWAYRASFQGLFTLKPQATDARPGAVREDARAAA